MFAPEFPRRRVVITGMDAISCLGNDLPAITHSLRTGFCGIEVDPERIPLGFRSPLTGVVRKVDPKEFLDRKDRKSMGETALYAAITAKRAIARSGCASLLENPRTGLIYGNDSSAEPLPAILDACRVDHNTGVLGSHAVIQALNSTTTINLGPLLKTQGISLSVSAACASGSHAIGLAWMLISLGLQDLIVAGGAQETNWWSMASFDGLRTFSTRLDEPKRSVRPFDRDRDGLVPSGGGATVIVESLDQARARGAPILAEILAYAFSSDGYHLTSGNSQGAERCLRQALTTASRTPKQIDYINAHATGTVAGDAAEAAAIHAVFGDSCPPVSSTKSMTGHECWMAGASEVVYSLLMMEHGFIAPNINYENRDPQVAPINIAARPVEGVRLDTVVSNSFGFGGTNACLVLARPS